MKRQLLASCVTLFVVTAITAGVASAQPPGGGFGGGRGGGRMGMMGGRGGGMMMLRSPEVQKELKLTPEQAQKLQAKQQEMMEAMRAAFQNGDNQDPEERQKRMADLQAEQKKAVNDVLTPEQQKRFRQLELQQMGSGALMQPDVAAELKLTDDQKKQLQEAQQKSMEEMRSMFQGQDFQSMTQEERTAMMAKMQAARKANDEKIVNVLTADQKKQWKEMQGEPFKFPPMGFGGGRGGGGFGGGRRQGGGAPGGNGQ